MGTGRARGKDTLRLVLALALALAQALALWLAQARLVLAPGARERRSKLICHRIMGPSHLYQFYIEGCIVVAITRAEASTGWRASFLGGWTWWDFGERGQRGAWAAFDQTDLLALTTPRSPPSRIQSLRHIKKEPFCCGIMLHVVVIVAMVFEQSGSE